jgi:hypothetical protein
VLRGEEEGERATKIKIKMYLNIERGTESTCIRASGGRARCRRGGGVRGRGHCSSRCRRQDRNRRTSVRIWRTESENIGAICMTSI